MRNLRFPGTMEKIDESPGVGVYHFCIYLQISERTKAGLERARRKGSAIGKRGKDKKPRSKVGYFKKSGMLNK